MRTQRENKDTLLRTVRLHREGYAATESGRACQSTIEVYQQKKQKRIVQSPAANYAKKQDTKN